MRIANMVNIALRRDQPTDISLSSTNVRLCQKQTWSGGDGKHHLSPGQDARLLAYRLVRARRRGVPGFNDSIAYPRATEFLRNDNGGRKVKRPNMGPAAWRHQNRDALNESHVLFDFFFVPFFFFAMMLLLRF